MTLSIFDAAESHGDRVALVGGGREYRFAELAEMARRAPAQSTLIAERTVDTAVAIYKALARAATLTLVHPRLTDAERSALPPPPSRGGIAVYTSGSTGAPRPVAITPVMLASSAAASAAHLGWRDGDRWLCPIPLAHVGGLSVVTRCLIARQCAVLGDATADTIARERVTIASVVPAQLARLVDGDAPPRLRAVLVGGAAASPELVARARVRGYSVLATYGMTETASQIATEREPGAGMIPLPGMHVRIESGRIFVRGPAVAGRGWLDTGDLGELDARGRLTVHGRADDVIVTGGENVHPLEVERALAAIPGVAEACVFGVPDPTWGQVVAAALVAAPAPDDGAIARALAHTLAPFKRPRRLCYLDALGRTPSGKIDRAATARAATPSLRTLAP
jgi:O-succinylbenzoic acid--CoA ligase